MQILSKFRGQSGGLSAAGLDLNDLGLCWVELRRDKVRGLVLEHCLFEPMAPGCVVQGEILEFSEVEAALTRLLGTSNAALNPRAIPSMAVAVPASLVTTHDVNVSAKVTEAVLSQTLQVEMAARLQLKSDEVCVDFVTRPAHAMEQHVRQAQKTELMVAAVPKEAVEDRIALVEGAGLPWRVDVVAMASQAAVLAARRALEVRAGRTHAMVALVQLEAGALQLDILQHAKVLHSEGFVLDTLPAGTPEPLLALPPGLLQALGSTYGSAGVGRPVQVWLAGPANMAAAWAGALQASSGLPCALVNAFEGMVPGDALDKRHRADSAQAVVACGLALMALSDLAAQAAAHQPFFNFFPHREAAIVQRRTSFVAQLGAVALSVLLASAVLRVVLSHQLQTQQDAQAGVKQELAGLDAELKRLAGAAAEMQRLQRQENVLIEFAQTRQQTPLMWQDISALLPDGLHLTSLGQDEQGVAVLSGQARSAAEVFDLIERLAGGSQHVERPELVDLSGVADAGAAAQAAPVERVVFTLRSRPP